MTSKLQEGDTSYVALWQLQDLEETIADATPEELPELYDKLLALSDGLTEAILDWANTQHNNNGLVGKVDDTEN